MRGNTAIKEQGELRHKVRKTQGVDEKVSVDSEHRRVKRELIWFTLSLMHSTVPGPWQGVQNIISESMSLIG